MLGAYFHVCF